MQSKLTYYSTVKIFNLPKRGVRADYLTKDLTKTVTKVSLTFLTTGSRHLRKGFDSHLRTKKTAKISLLSVSEISSY